MKLERIPFRSLPTATMFREPDRPCPARKRVIQLWAAQADNEVLYATQVRVSGGMTEGRIKIVRRVDGGGG